MPIMAWLKSFLIMLVPTLQKSSQLGSSTACFQLNQPWTGHESECYKDCRHGNRL
ncbi:hypothetical protein J6590_102955 [Homalodisca vitripennis]|nr:hypothetical protein J6590_102955 [Homalodisca vitripennis]